MALSSCPGDACKHYRFHEDLWKRNFETGEFYQVPSSWHCHNPLALKDNKPNRKTGGVPLGRVCWTCSGKWYEVKI